MPRTATFLRKSLKTICVDTVLFFAIFALVGHLTINFWERYTIQYELTTMKQSLHTLKDTLTSIGKAYDSLHTELKDLFYIVDNKQIDTPKCEHKKEIETKCKAENRIDKKLRNFQVQTVTTKPNRRKVDAGVATHSDKQTESGDHVLQESEIWEKHAATNTKNPPKNTGTATKIPNSENERLENESRHFHSYHNYLRCYNKDLDHCKQACRRAAARI